MMLCKKMKVIIKKILIRYRFKTIGTIDEQALQRVYNELQRIGGDSYNNYYLLAFYIFKRTNRPDLAKIFIEKSRENFPPPNVLEQDSVIKSLREPTGKGRSVPNLISRDDKVIKQIYMLSGEIYSELKEVDKALEAYESLILETPLLNNDYKKKPVIYLYTFRNYNQFSLADLIHDAITVSPVTKMNDPFDTLIHLWSDPTLLETLCKNKSHIKPFSDSFKKFRIRSFCSGEEENYKNTLMWAHYADGHKGFCIKYKLTHDFFKRQENRLMVLKNVVYKKEKIDLTNMRTITNETAFTLKDKCWEYENEVRLIVYDRNNNVDFYRVPLGDSSCVDSIYFGYQCPQDYIDTIRELFRGREAQKDHTPKFFKMKFNATDANNLDSEEIKD